MKYINKETKQLIIDNPIHKSTTKFETKDGKVKENTKYIAHIPKEILIFLLEKYKPFDAESSSDAEYIDAMLKEKYYLCFYDHPGKDEFELYISKDKFIKDGTASVTVKKQVKSDSYFFTVSKKVFSELKNDDNSVSIFRFVLDLDSDDDYFKNSIVNVKLV